MRILQVITSLRIGGAENLVVNLVHLLQASGHSVDLLLFNGSDSFLKKRLEQYNINIISFSTSGSVYNPIFIFKLPAILKNYDIIHTHNTACQYYVAIAKRVFKLRNVKLVTTEHSTSNRRRKIWGFRLLDRWMYREYEEIISISDKATEKLQDYIGKEYKISTICNGIDILKFVNAVPISMPFQINDDDIIVSMIAGFRSEKDQDTLIRAMKYLPDNFKLWLIGDGIRRAELESLVRKEALENRVVFWGIQTDIPGILKASDIVVMSSHWEGLSLSSLEGMCVGKPFIASDVDGLHEIVDGYGILFPHQDEISLANSILQLENDSTYYQQVADRCLRRAKDFDINKTAKEYLQVYKNILFKQSRNDY